jgi:ribonuclease HI
MSKTRVIVDACCHVANAHLPGRAGRGYCACGVLIIDACGQELEHAKYLGEMTVPEAEFQGLIYALDKASECTRHEIEVWMDSELVIKWMRKEYRLKKDHIKPLYDKAETLSRRFQSVEFFHHSRNTVNAKWADRIAAAEYDKHHKPDKAGGK